MEIVNDAKMTITLPTWLRDAAKAKARATDTTLSREIRQHFRDWLLEAEDDRLVDLVSEVRRAGA